MSGGGVTATPSRVRGAVAGGLLSIELAHWGSQLVAALVPSTLPGSSEIGLNLSVLVFSLVLVALAGVDLEVRAGTIVGLLNNDLEIVDGGWLGEMVAQSLRPEIGVVGAKLLYPDGTIQHGGIILGVGRVAGHAHKHLPADSHGYFSRAQVAQNLSAVTAAMASACARAERALLTSLASRSS